MRKNAHGTPKPFPEERWDVLDKNRVPTGKTLRRGEKRPEGAYHIDVLGWVVNSRGEFLISRRCPEKNNPLLWETTGGAKQAGEDSLSAIIRELQEELGVDVRNNRPIFLGSKERINGIYFDCWMFFKNVSIETVVLQEGETCDAKWVTDQEFKAMIRAGQVTRVSTEIFPLAKGWRDLLTAKEGFAALSGER